MTAVSYVPIPRSCDYPALPADEISHAIVAE